MKKKHGCCGSQGQHVVCCPGKFGDARLRRAIPHHEFILQTITTLGDRAAQWDRTDTGIFVKEIEDALLGGHIDMAIHSIKDMPSKLPRGLIISAVTKRQDPRDVLITNDGCGLFSLPPCACIGTSSLRRKAQVLHVRPDIRVIDLRGNLDTRMRKLRTGKYDAIIVAAAGLRRLGIRHAHARPIPVEIMLPQSGQGALGIEIRSADIVVQRLVSWLDDPCSRACVDAERSFLMESNAGCRMPVAAFASIRGRNIVLEGLVISTDGKNMVRLRAAAAVKDAQKLGRGLARQVLRHGGAQILKGIHNGP